METQEEQASLSQLTARSTSQRQPPRLLWSSASLQTGADNAVQREYLLGKIQLSDAVWEETELGIQTDRQTDRQARTHSLALSHTHTHTHTNTHKHTLARTHARTHAHQTI